MKFFRKAFWVLLALYIGLHVFGFSKALAKGQAAQGMSYLSLPANAPVIVRVFEGFACDEIREVEFIPLVVAREIKIRGHIVIREGAIVKAQVRHCIPPQAGGMPGKIIISLQSVKAVDGSDIKISGTVTHLGEERKGQAATAAVTTSMLCAPMAAVGVLIKGGHGALPRNYEIVGRTRDRSRIKMLSPGEARELARRHKKEAMQIMANFRKALEKVRKEKAEEAQRFETPPKR